MSSRNFGEVFGQRLRAEHVTFVARTLRNAAASITEVRSDNPTRERSDSLPGADVFGVGLQLRDFPRHEWWEDGRGAPVVALGAGQTTLYDLKRDPRFTMNNPFHSIHVVLPRALMDAVAEEAGARRIVGLRYSPGQGIDDRVIEPLLLSLRPVLVHPEETSGLFVDHTIRAVAHHVAFRYGDMRPRRVPAGGLGAWQRRRVMDFMDAHLDGNITTLELARQCGLSGSYFTTAFRTSTGLTPHRWLKQRRVEQAKRLLADLALPVAEIALACGFANQSHFTRVFSAVAGCPPAEWRRRKRSGAASRE